MILTTADTDSDAKVYGLEEHHL